MKVQDLSDHLKEHKSCPDKIKELSEKLKEHDSCTGKLADLNKQLLDHASCAGKIQELESARDGLQIELAEAMDDVQYWEKRHKDDVVSAAFIGAQDFAYKFLPHHGVEIPPAYQRPTPEQLAMREKASTKGKEVLWLEVNEEEQEEEQEEENPLEDESEEEGSEEEIEDENPKVQNQPIGIDTGNVEGGELGGHSLGSGANARQLVGEQSTEVVIEVDDHDTRDLGEPNAVGTVRNDCHPEDSGTGDIGAVLLGDLNQD